MLLLILSSPFINQSLKPLSNFIFKYRLKADFCDSTCHSLLHSLPHEPVIYPGGAAVRCSIACHYWACFQMYLTMLWVKLILYWHTQLIDCRLIFIQRLSLKLKNGNSREKNLTYSGRIDLETQRKSPEVHPGPGADKQPEKITDVTFCLRDCTAVPSFRSENRMCHREMFQTSPHRHPTITEILYDFHVYIYFQIHAAKFMMQDTRNAVL